MTVPILEISILINSTWIKAVEKSSSGKKVFDAGIKGNVWPIKIRNLNDFFSGKNLLNNLCYLSM